MAEIPQVRLGVPRRLDGFAQRLDRFTGLLQPLPPTLEAVLQQAFHVFAVIALERLARVFLDRSLQRPEQILVVDDVAVLLVLSVQSVDAADRLEETVILHLLVDVEIRCGRGIETGQQLVHDDQELHLPGLVDEPPLDLLLELLGFVHRLVLGLTEVVRQHLSVDVVFQQLLGQALACFFSLDVACSGTIGGDDGAPVLQSGPTECLEEAAGRVDAVRHEHGVAAPALQAVTRLHIDQDVVHDLLNPVPRARDLPHGAPLLPELRPGQVAEPLGLEIEPLIDLRLRRDVLVDVTRLVAQVQNHLVVHRLIVLVGVDVRAEDLDTALLVGPEERGSRKADERGSGEDGLHGLVELAGLGAVTLVHEDEDLAGRAETARHMFLDVAHVLVDAAFLGTPELVDERTDQRLGGVAKHLRKVGPLCVR